ncbi:lipase [Coprinellus micaceus]|uniref:Lipase n=1 Tax=Coprinellus micaceus TaxID=71717 RepID=A0A4Y7SIY6_COPMI|nr:lipase [Coprinellus micaceus]
MVIVSTFLLCARLAALAFAAPASSFLEIRQSVTTLSASEVSVYKPYSWYAGAAYCPPASTLAWNCGIKCSANSGFVPIASGGDGAIIQHWYVGWDASLQTLIVGYQGTDPKRLIPLLTDVNLLMTPLRPDLFPGVGLFVLTHTGFNDAHALSARAVLTAVRAGVSRYNATTVTLTGHSLGGALAAISTLHLALNLPSNHIPPVSEMNRINNKRDIVPTVPSRVLGFAHTEGEIHIVDSNEWKNCPGQDNTSPECTIGYAPNIIEGDLDNHNGPYDEVFLGTAGCE